MKITGLKLKNGRVQVFIDEEYVFSCSQNFVVDNMLFREREISEEEFIELREKALQSIIEFKLIEYATKNRYSLSELRRKVNTYSLKKFKIPVSDNIFDTGVEKLKRAYLYDNDRIIRNWIEVYISRSKSLNHIKNKLIQKGFLKEDIQNILSTYESSETIKDNLRNLLEKKFNSLKQKDLPLFELKQKLTHFAISKGFPYQKIKEFIQEML
jgi:SOS response regulatory protein OraA/RecX